MFIQVYLKPESGRNKGADDSGAPIETEKIWLNTQSSLILEEFIHNEEETVMDSRLNDGRPTNIPLIWHGKKLSIGDAREKAVKSTNPFPVFADRDTAQKYASGKTLTAFHLPPGVLIYFFNYKKHGCMHKTLSEILSGITDFGDGGFTGMGPNEGSSPELMAFKQAQEEAVAQIPKDHIVPAPKHGPSPGLKNGKKK